MAYSSATKVASMSMVDAGVPRRDTLHSASVHISSLTKATSNPQPWRGRDREEGRTSEPLQQGYLSPMKLVQLTEEPDLSQVSYLELSVNTLEHSVGNFGVHLPHLAQLRFTSSVIPCVRDLGTSLSSVRILWMSRCRLKDLDGLPALHNLQEFYLAFNNVEDISVIAMLSSLDVLDLESNNLKDKDQLGYLALCPSLVSLTLEGNPLSIQLAETAGGVPGYRAAIHEAVPRISVLDDVPLCGGQEVGGGGGAKETDLSARSSVFVLSEAGMEKDWHIVQKSIKEGLQVDRDASIVSPVGRPMTSPVARPMTAPPQRSISPTPSPGTAQETDESSDLTHGLSQVICGNPVRALRARRHHGLASQSAVGGASHDNDLMSRLQNFCLDPVSEHLTVTRAKSEENLFMETRQPNHLLTPKTLTYSMADSQTTPTTADERTPTPPPLDAGPPQGVPHAVMRRPIPPQSSPPAMKSSRTPTPPQSAPPAGTAPSYLNTRSPTPPQSAPPPTKSSSWSKRIPTPPLPNTDPSLVKPKPDFRHRRYRKTSSDTQRSFTNGT